MLGTKELRPRCLALGFLLINIHAFHIVLSQENATTASTHATPTTSGQTNSTDVTMTSSHINATNFSTATLPIQAAESTTEMTNTTVLSNETVMVTEITAEIDNSTVLLNDLLTNNETRTTELFSENVTSTTETEDIEVTTTESMPVNTQTTTTEYTNASTGITSYETPKYDNESSPANYTQTPPGNETTASGNHTASAPETPPVTTLETIQRTLPTAIHPTTFIVPILIFAGLIFLLAIMIFTAVVTKSRVKKSTSSYHLTPAANSVSTSVGFRNTAYEHGDVADDTDRQCSMREMRLEGKTSSNGNALQDFSELDEELTRL